MSGLETFAGRWKLHHPLEVLKRRRFRSPVFELSLRQLPSTMVVTSFTPWREFLASGTRLVSIERWVPANLPMKRTGLRPPLIARYVGQTRDRGRSQAPAGTSS